MKHYVVNRRNHPDDSDDPLSGEGETVNLVGRDGRREVVRILEAADTIAGQDGGHSLRVRAAGCGRPVVPVPGVRRRREVHDVRRDRT